MKRKRKSYNPFKMWGSWILAIIFLCYYYFSTRYFLFDTRDILLRMRFTLSVQTGGHIMAIGLTFFIGFLIGWGINSLWRKFKK